MREADLNAVLEQWARDYGLGGIPREQSVSILHKMMMYQCAGITGIAIPTTDKTTSDYVNDAVREMENVGGRYHRAAQCLRADYFCPKHYSYKDRIRSLRRIGVDINKDEYYDCLTIARAYVLSALNARSR